MKYIQNNLIIIKKEKNTWKTALLHENKELTFPKIEISSNGNQLIYEEFKRAFSISSGRFKILKKFKSTPIVKRSSDNILRRKLVHNYLIETDRGKIKNLKWFDLEKALRSAFLSEIKNQILEIIIYLEKKNKIKPEIKTIVVAAGGKGERMKIKKISKLLLPIRNRPFFGYLMDILHSEVNFEKIYVFTHYYTQQIKKFLNRNYKNNNSKIKVIYTSANSTCQQLYSAKNLPDKDFIYMDGNVICDPSLFKELIVEHQRFHSLITLAVSPQIIAPTHLKIELGSKDKITGSFSGLRTDRVFKKNMFCSMGIFAISRRIFDIFPDLIYFYDLDFIIDLLIKSKYNSYITPFVYKKDWYCLHNKKDYRLIKQKSGKLLQNLRNSGIL